MEFKIGLVAPSKAGKTTLLATTFSEMSRLLSGNQQGIQYWAADPRTQNAIARVLAEYRAVTSADDIFAVPQMAGSAEVYDYKFSYTIPVAAGAPQRLNVWFKDFPGGLVGMSEFEEQVGPFVRESSALVVPVPADILMEWKRTDKVNDPVSIRKNVAATFMLRVHDTVAIIRNWIELQVQRKSPVLLIFAPVRCEAYFNDNGGTVDKSDELFSAIENLYIKDLQLTPDQKSCVQIEMHAVDTYGTVELESVELVESPVGDLLESKFRKRLSAGNEIKSKGAFDLLATITEFELKKAAKVLEMDVAKLENTIKNRNWFEMLRDFFFGSNEKRQLVETMRANEAAYQAIAIISRLAPPNELRQRIINKVMD